jgi:hypothetical protein
MTGTSGVWILPDEVPSGLRTHAFRLEPLDPRHNERDHRAWMSSIEHIRATPGFAAGDWGDDTWPEPMSLAQNLGDLQMHRREFDSGEAFAWSVIDPDGIDVIGCVYIDPDPTRIAAAMVRCWVTADRAVLDALLAGSVRDWISMSWPIESVRFPGRD